MFPDAGHSYTLEVDGWVIGQITEVSAPAGAGQVALTRRLTGSGSGFERWLRRTGFGGPSGVRRDGTLVAYDVSGHPVARLLLRDAWPASLHIGRPSAGDPSVRSERLVVVYTDAQSPP